MTQSLTRCTYCRTAKDTSAFAHQGDHVIPASLGGEWVDGQICATCETTSNRVADQLIATDPLVVFLRNAYQISDRRYGQPPEACRFSVRVPQGGVIKVTITRSGVELEPAMAPTIMQALGINADADQPTLRAITAQLLGIAEAEMQEGLTLARAGQEFADKPTPPPVWSRFMAKVGLAVARELYGDDWLDTRQAAVLSADLLEGGPPRFAQRTHYPLVEPVWPYEPPKHRLWVEFREDTALLMIVLFGQVIGAVPVSDHRPPPDGRSAWSLDPIDRSVHRSSYPAILLATAAAQLTRAGHNVLTSLMPGQEFLYVEDGPNGPADLPVPTFRADSPSDALRKLQHDVGLPQTDEHASEPQDP